MGQMIDQERERIRQGLNEKDPAQRLIRETHVARGLVASVASQRPSYQASGVGYVEREGGEEVISFDLTDGGRKFRVFIVEVGGDGVG